MGTIILRLLKDRRISIMVYSVSGILLLWMYIAMFPGIRDSAEQFNEVLQNYPKEFFKVFNIEELNFAQIENFLAVEHFSIVWPLLVIFLSISFATLSIATGIERGTIELVLAQPISRLKLFTGRYIAGLIALVIFAVCSIFAVAPLSELHSVEYRFSHFLNVALLSFLFGWAVYSVAFLFSALFSERSKSFMGTGILLILMYVLNIIANLKDNLNDLKYGSFFYYYKYNAALVKGELDTTSILVFAGVIIAFTLAAAWWFRRRDIAV